MQNGCFKICCYEKYNTAAAHAKLFFEKPRTKLHFQQIRQSRTLSTKVAKAKTKSQHAEETKEKYQLYKRIKDLTEPKDSVNLEYKER